MLPDSVRIAPPVFDAIAAYGIGGLAVFVAVIFVSLLSVAARRGQRVAVAVGACGVLAASAAVAASGRLARFDALPPPMLLMIASVFVMGFGLGACVLAGLMQFGVAVPRWSLWAWNVWGWWCLAAIAVIAVTTSPMVRLFGDDPRNLNTWVLYFPHVWLPVVLVTVAIAGHVMVTRALRRR